MKIYPGTFAIVAVPALFASLPAVAFGNSLRTESSIKKGDDSPVDASTTIVASAVTPIAATGAELAKERDAPIRRTLRSLAVQGLEESCHHSSQCKAGLNCDHHHKKCYHSPRHEGEPCLGKETGKSRCNDGLTCVEGLCDIDRGEDPLDAEDSNEFNLSEQDPYYLDMGGKSGEDPLESNNLFDLMKKTHDACPADYTCPLDSECVLKADGKPGCFCPKSGLPLMEGISCAVLESFEPVLESSLDDMDDCDPKEAGCGDGALCFQRHIMGRKDNKAHEAEVHCICPGSPLTVPKGEVCVKDKDGDDLDSAGRQLDDEEEGDDGDGEEELSKRCVDTPDWKDDEGEGCAWYLENKPRGCPNLPLGHGASDNCCHCMVHGAKFLPDDAFTIFFISDIEYEYRNHGREHCYKLIKAIIDIALKAYKYKHYPYARMIPELFIHGGDVSDNSFGGFFDGAGWTKGINPADSDELYEHVFQQIYNSAKVPFISIIGNHDVKKQFERAEKEATKFMMESLKKSKAFGVEYEIIPGEDWFNNIYYVKYKGLQIGTVNNRLENDDESPGLVWPGFKAKFDTSKPALFFSHQPLSNVGPNNHVSDDWKDFIGKFPNPTHFAGHTHCYAHEELYTTDSGDEKATIKEWVAPYLWIKPGNDACSNEPPGFLSILVSPSKGVLEVQRINVPQFNV